MQGDYLIFIIACTYTGFIGDAVLQLVANYRGDLAGLNAYFKQHGRIESLFIATGIMALCGIIWITFAGQLWNSFIAIAIYGFVLDVIWRQFNLFPSLNSTLYAQTTQIESGIWGSISIVIPLAITQYYAWSNSPSLNM